MGSFQMAIGLDFVKKVDKQWKKHINSEIIEKKGMTIDSLIEDTDKEDNSYKEDNKEEQLDRSKEMWNYWKNRYFIDK